MLSCTLTGQQHCCVWMRWFLADRLHNCGPERAALITKRLLSRL
ncbi:hypothetical protein AcetOrient_orf02387 [Acetobacter orientalis]|uniref:Uncharacterized protein n=1 Tax=Acetobacter orientalis TaxID=146474 RepID=A0A2Z5ZHS7_9PROT|nr:hypothetical protein AcetOrient_orf02387 [Acetobacter orientalis]